MRFSKPSAINAFMPLWARRTAMARSSAMPRCGCSTSAASMKEVVPGPKLMERVHALAEALGPFPRGALKFETHDHAGVEKPPKLSADSPERQKNRHLKCECLREDCGYIANVSARNLREKGAPLCPIHKTPMWHVPLPDPPKEEPVDVTWREVGPDLPKESPPLQIAHQPEGGQ